MENNQTNNRTETVTSIISEVCKITLTDKDCFNGNEIKAYIEKLSKTDLTTINSINKDDESVIQSIIFIVITDYLKGYSDKILENNRQSPFVFDSGGNYQRFVVFFKKTYKDIIGGEFPFIFDYIFTYIKNTSEHFLLFEKFYDIRSKETYEKVLSDAKGMTLRMVNNSVNGFIHKAIDTINKSAQDAEAQAKEARFQAESAERDAKKAADNAKDAAKVAVSSAVKSEMVAVSSKASENSVTILGIFAGIVLTIVAGLFYSSSVLENVNTANFFRLTSVASMVGLVCYHLIALMFRSVAKIKDPNTDVSKLNGIDKIISAFLIVAIVVAGILQFVFPTKNETKYKETPVTSIHGEIDVNTKQEYSSSDLLLSSNTSSTLETTSSCEGDTSKETSTNIN